MSHPYFSEDHIQALAEGVLNCNLPKTQWTHEAHLVVTLYLLIRRPDIDLDLVLPGIIKRYNESVGTPNSESDGYHETITRFYLAAIRHFCARHPNKQDLAKLSNDLINSPEGARDFPLRYYSSALLFSKKARLRWTRPDLSQPAFLEQSDKYNTMETK